LEHLLRAVLCVMGPDVQSSQLRHHLQMATDAVL
jgi:hypothetical protein